ncbi:MAG TPA: adenylate/guanylate cyclase domain-containing protein, partial [Candidatus Sulfotelmatobacter sp.]|nr:adenylate/guanylate cyclase domain-containing protein [Candidatus Sulfotelmatobacter sp.]
MIVCPACGAENPERARFCLDCGSRLQELAVATTPSRRTVTILFSDVVDSTALGESLDPEALRSVMADYFAVMRAAIERHSGTVEKFIGDAIMAVFGLPTVHEDDALRAVRAALEMRQALAALNARLAADRRVTIAMRTGLH